MSYKLVNFIIYKEYLFTNQGKGQTEKSMNNMDRQFTRNMGKSFQLFGK